MYRSVVRCVQPKLPVDNHVNTVVHYPSSPPGLPYSSPYS